jgi:hypothetical protein
MSESKLFQSLGPATDNGLQKFFFLFWELLIIAYFLNAGQAYHGASGTRL